MVLVARISRVLDYFGLIMSSGSLKVRLCTISTDKKETSKGAMF